MKRWISLLLIIMLSASYSISLSEEVGHEGIVILDDESETSIDDIALEITDDFDQLVEDIPEEIDLLDADLLALELQTSMDSIETDDVVSNSVQGNYGVDLESEGYVTDINPFYRKHYWGECTWYCWGRAYEKCGVKLSWSTNDVFGNAKDWYKNAKAWAETHDVEYSVGTEPRTNSIAVSTSGYYGHVVFIEKIEDGQVYYSECNGDAGAHTYGEGSKPLSNLPYVGYIYLRGVVASGQCGDNVYWDLYEDKVLEIHGSGAMWNYDYMEEQFAPWNDYSYDEEYDDEAHSGEVNIETVYIHEGVTSIGLCAFSGMYIKSVSIPSSVISIGENAFLSCERITEIDLPDGITIIPKSAFDGCFNLTRVKLPGNLRTIDEAAFWKTGLEGIDFPNSLEEIHRAAFSNCMLKSIHIPPNVSLIDSWAFERNDISKITVDSKNKYYVAVKNVLYTKERDMLVLCAQDKTGIFTVPKGVKYIGAAAFNNSKLSEIILQDGILSIGTYAFELSDSLRKINLPTSLVSIDDHAFVYCEYGGTLAKLTVYAEYGSYAQNYCRSHDIKHTSVPYPDEEGFLENYIITKTLSKTGSNGKVTINKGEKLQLIPVKRNGSTIAIKSCKSNSKIAKVSSSGIVTGVSAGETKVTVQPKGTKAMTIKVKVKDPYAPTGIKLNKSGTVKLALGKTLQLKATVTPSTAETTLTWSSSDSRIAKVNKKGKVTAVKKGTATITVTTSNGKTAKVKIKVVKGSGGGGGGGGW